MSDLTRIFSSAFRQAAATRTGELWRAMLDQTHNEEGPVWDIVGLGLQQSSSAPQHPRKLSTAVNDAEEAVPPVLDPLEVLRNRKHKPTLFTFPSNAQSV